MLIWPLLDDDPREVSRAARERAVATRAIIDVGTFRLSCGDMRRA